MFLIFIAIILWLGITAWGSFDIRLNYFVKAYSSNKKINRNIVALTFDDGPTEITPEILNLLEKYNQKATFFCIGKQIEKYPETAKI
ncbi:MAG: polysaccharide deacetylase family protein, partial [Myroides sp.]